MKIVFLSYLQGYGGAEKQSIMLANNMASRGHEVTVIAVSDYDPCFAIDERVKLEHLPDKHSSILRVFSRYRDVKKALIAIRPDVTVHFWFQSAYLTAFMKKGIAGKIIYSERGDPGDREYHGALGLIRKLALPRIDGFVFQSKGARNYFDSKVRRRSVIIPNPVFINAKDFQEIRERRKAIVTIGRLHPQKNQKLLIDAFAMIADRIPEYSLEIYGRGDLEPDLRDQIIKLGMEDRIYLKGDHKDVHHLIYDASLFVLSSDYEGLPNALLEAMTLGIPCISTDCRPGGAREIIEDGKNGFIVKVGDREALSERMLQLILERDLAESFSERARKSTRFQPKEIYDQWEKYLEKDNAE